MKKNKSGINITPITTLLAIIWIAFALNFVTGGTINDWFAVKPRSISGLIGIITHPFTHGDIWHIVSNSIPFFILSLLVAYSCGMNRLITIWILGTLGSGIGIWLFSSSQVVGASGVVFALNGFLLARSYTHPNLNTIITAIVVLFLYSGALFSLLNFTATGISWSGHISGFVTGIASAFLMRAPRNGRRKQ